MQLPLLTALGLTLLTRQKKKRAYDYRLTIKLESRTDLNAYSVTIEKLDFFDDRISSFKHLDKDAHVSIKSGEAIDLVFDFTVVLPVDVHSETKYAKDRLVELNNKISFIVKFEDARRKFKSKFNIAFKYTDGFEYSV